MSFTVNRVERTVIRLKDTEVLAAVLHYLRGIVSNFEEHEGKIYRTEYSHHNGDPYRSDQVKDKVQIRRIKAAWEMLEVL